MYFRLLVHGVGERSKAAHVVGHVTVSWWEKVEGTRLPSSELTADRYPTANFEFLLQQGGISHDSRLGLLPACHGQDKHTAAVLILDRKKTVFQKQCHHFAGQP